MPAIVVPCPHCKREISIPPELVGKECRCPLCMNSLIVPGESTPPAATAGLKTAPSAPTPPVPAPPAPSQPSQPAAPPDDLPEFMKANRRVAERTCPACSVQIDIGDDVFNCRACGASMHLSCHAAAGGCMNPACPNTRAQRPASPEPALQSGAAQDAGEKPCRFCGERIKADARKCRFCGEFQDDAERQAVTTSAAAVTADDKLTGWEIALGILCSTIACILAIVYIVQGKKKGWKLLVLALVAGMIYLMITSAMK